MLSDLFPDVFLRTPSAAELRVWPRGRWGGVSVFPWSLAHRGGGHVAESSAPALIYPDESHYFSSAAPAKQHLYRPILPFVECFRIQDKLPAVTAREEEEED